MKVKILKECIDGATGKKLNPGHVMDLPNDRAKLAIERGRAVEVKEIKPQSQEKTEKADK